MTHSEIESNSSLKLTSYVNTWSSLTDTDGKGSYPDIDLIFDISSDSKAYCFFIVANVKNLSSATNTLYAKITNNVSAPAGVYTFSKKLQADILSTEGNRNLVTAFSLEDVTTPITAIDFNIQIYCALDPLPTSTITYSCGTPRNIDEFQPTAYYEGLELELDTFPVVANKLFMGWYLDEEYTNEVKFPYVVGDDVTFYAKYLDGTLDQYNYSYIEETNTYQVVKNTQGNALPQKFVIPDAYMHGEDIVDVTSVVAADTYKNTVLGSNTTVQEAYLNNFITRASMYIFFQAKSLTKLYMPKVQYIDYGAIVATAIVSDIYAPEVIGIGDRGIMQNSSISTLNFPKLETIGQYGLSQNSQLNNINMPSIKYIGVGAFNECSNLIVDIPEGTLWIGNSAYNHCLNTTQTTITIPSTLVQIGGDTFVGNNNENSVFGTHVFYDCATETLKRFIVAEGNENFVTHEGVLYTKDYKYLVAYPPAKVSPSYVIPEGCVDAFEMSFSRAYRLKSLTISDTFTVGETRLPSDSENKYASLSQALYSFTNVEEILVHDTNTKYKSIDGILYTSDNKLACVPTAKARGSKLVLDSSLTAIELAALCYYYDSSNPNHEVSVNGTVVSGRPYEIVIGKNVNTISEIALWLINRYPWTITIASENANYTTDENGKLVAKS